MITRRTRLYILFFLVAAVLAGLIAMRSLPARGVRQRLEAIRAAGLPVSAIELNTWYRTVPIKDNRALLLVEATRDLISAPPEIEQKKGAEITPEYAAAVAAYLQKNEAVLEKLHRAPELSGSRFPVDFSGGFSTLLPHLSGMKKLVQFLKLDAEHQARTGHPEEAVQSLKSGFSVATALRAEPIYISELVAIACSAITVNALERVLNETPLSATQLAALQTTLAQQENDTIDGVFRGLVGERALGITTFQANYNQYQGLSGGTSSGGADWLKALAFQAYATTGLRQRDLDCYLEMMNLFIESRRAGFPEAIRGNDEAAKIMRERFSTGLGRFAIFTRMLMPSLENGTRKEANLAARVRCGEVVVGVEQFRLDHDGALPEKLDELAPKYLHKIPADAFDGQPLVYEKLPVKGYRVTSAATSADRKRSVTAADDVGLTIKR